MKHYNYMKVYTSKSNQSQNEKILLNNSFSKKILAALIELVKSTVSDSYHIHYYSCLSLDHKYCNFISVLICISSNNFFVLQLHDAKMVMEI